MKRALLILLCVFLSGCEDEGYELYTNPATAEHSVFMENEGAESTPIIWGGRVLIVTFHRPASGYYVTIADLETRELVTTISTPDFTIGCAYVHDGRIYIFGTSSITETGGVTFNNNTISLITSDDLRNWTSPVVVYRSPDGKAAWNVSVTKTETGFVMAYDHSESPLETSPSQARFLFSEDLEKWIDMPGKIVGIKRYFAAVTVRYHDGWYYAMYVQSLSSKDGGYLPNVVRRSRDLHTWQVARYAIVSPLLNPTYLGSATDADMVEFNGKVIIIYLTGDQGGPYGTKTRVAEYPGDIGTFLASHFY